MPRPRLIALAGAAAVVVLLAVWGATRFGAGKSEPIVGTWRADGAPQCDAGAILLTVASEHLDLQWSNQPAKRILKILAFETEGDAHRLRVNYGEDTEADYALFVPYQVAGDTLTFGKVDWTPEARAKYANAIAMSEDALGQSMDALIGQTFRDNQPFHRCPG